MEIAVNLIEYKNSKKEIIILLPYQFVKKIILII